MLSTLLGKNTTTIENKSVISEKISKMNLTEMRSYLKEKIPDLELSEEGLKEVMLRLTTQNTSSKKFYIESDDMASKKKKAFDLVLLVAESKKITVTVVEEIQKFTKVYSEIIAEYDKEFKEIYASRFSKAIASAITNIEHITQLHTKMNTLSE